MRKAGTANAKIPARHGVLSAATYSLELAIITACYLGLAALWLSAPSINLAATPLWPPSGLALALVLVRGFRIWPAILVGLFSFQLMAGHSVLESASVGVGSLFAALAGAAMTLWGVRRLDLPGIALTVGGVALLVRGVSSEGLSGDVLAGGRR